MCVVFSCVNIGFPFLWQTITSEKNQVISYLYDNSTVPMFIHIEYMFWFMFLMIQLCTIRAPTWSIVRPMPGNVCDQHVSYLCRKIYFYVFWTVFALLCNVLFIFTHNLFKAFNKCIFTFYTQFLWYSGCFPVWIFFGM